ncbi:MAG: UTP--glucose-1-phosphate uridylyltransferase [Myxococcaceae bacterium]
MSELTAEELAFLKARGFDEVAFETRRQDVRSGQLSEAGGAFQGTLEPPRPDDVVPLSPKHAALGDSALRAGKLARLVFAGGRATRFGGGVKGAVDVLPGESFLGLLLADARATAARFGAPVPFVIMGSYGSTELIREHLEQRGLMGPDVLLFEQTLSVRLTPQGELFRGANGKPSYYPPGHGDFFQAFRGSGTLQRLRDQGIEHLFTSNVDNLGASIDPRVLGHHLAAGKDLTVEVTARGVGDVAGAPVRGNGQLRLLEGFRFPKGTDFTRFPEISINSYWFRLQSSALDELGAGAPLRYYLTTKNVEGRPAVQLEMITGEATELPVLSAAYLRVPREGRPGHFHDGRFYPVKERAHLGDVSRALGFTRLRQEFEKRFGSGEGLRYISASGRINLLGEHTDYSDGFALPAATNRRILGVFQKAEGVTVHSRQMDSVATSSTSSPAGDWRRYVEAAVKVSPVKVGFRAIIDSDIPPGSGLSSSAALELLLLQGMHTLAGVEISPIKLALLAQKAEWDAGVKVGTLDPLSIVFGKRGQISLLDTRALSSTPVKVKLGDNQLIIGFTKPRALVGSAYDDRRKQVEEAARGLGVKALRDVSSEMFAQESPKLDPLLARRARHVVSENRRVMEAKVALERGDVDAFKTLMITTHQSLRDDFQVSSPELDAMVECALHYAYVHGVKLGARMMGGGFGGPVLMLVPSAHAEGFKRWVGEKYREKTGEAGAFWDVTLEEGLVVLPEAAHGV